MVSTRVVAAAAASVVAMLGASSVLAQQYPYPSVWPNQHTHKEIMYVPDLGTRHFKPVYYDFTNVHYRADIFLLEGSPFDPLAPINQSSYWLSDNLYIYDFWPVPSCVYLNLGFGMMNPAWFLGGTQNGTVWHAKWFQNLTGFGDNGMYVNTLWMQSVVEGQGNFDYFSYLNNTGTYKAGDPHHFSAPSPLGLVVNEYNMFGAANFSVNDPTFDLPAGISCINTTMPTSNLGEVLGAVAKHAPWFLPEVTMAARSQMLL